MKYKYRASNIFWKKFYQLPSEQKNSVREAWKLFKENPFAPQLNTHRIHYLSSLASRSVYAVEIENDLRSIFYIDGDTVYTFDIGTHAVHKN